MTLRLNTNSVGLQLDVDLPNTTTGNDVKEEVRRKDITGCSFSFTVLEDDWKYPEEGSIERTIIKIKELFDVGPVTYPAYPDTSVAVRSMDVHKKQIEQEARAETESKQISKERQRAMKRAYDRAGRIINRNKKQ